MANEKRLIDANEAVRQLEDSRVDDPTSGSAGYRIAHTVILDILGSLPTVDAVEVVHGRWIEHRPNVYECTACHTWYGNYGGCDEWAYCPNCGAKMDGGNEDGQD